MKALFVFLTISLFVSPAQAKYSGSNATKDIWWIFKGQNNPRLWWELIVDT